MFSAKTYAARRNMLRTKIGSGIVLFPGNPLSPNNYPNNAYYFRQDSSFLYYFGLNIPSLAGLFDAAEPQRTAVCIFADKEEIGSEGVSGMLSAAFDKFMGELCDTQGVLLRDCFAKSFCVSADVTAAYDPSCANAF